jgi:predicted Rossmann fold flavoprotein
VFNNHFDVIVVGAGPAGMMAAGQAAHAGARTLLLEKMDRPGRKLQLTGQGRCNLTNTAPLDAFIEHFGPRGRFLHSAFSRFFSQDLITFLQSLGVETLVERGGRVFPVSQDALEIVRALEAWMSHAGVTLMPSARVKALTRASPNALALDVIKPGDHRRNDVNDQIIEVQAKAIVIATGGASYPGTGSTGDGYTLAESLGHTLIPIRPALVPLVTRGQTAANLQGLSLRNVMVRLMINGREEDARLGEMLFTHFGLSGPVILAMSRAAVDGLIAQDDVQVSIDLKPALDESRLDARILRDLDLHGKKQFRTLLGGLLPQKMIPTCLAQIGIAGEKEAHQITAEERQRLNSWLKDLRFEVVGHRTFNQAIITAGGVNTKEVDPRSMGSKLVPGLYFAGEVLDLDADTGGYNLQAAFSTGWVAGRSAAGYALHSA